MSFPALATAALAVLLAATPAFAADAPSPFPRLPKSELQVVTATGSRDFQVWIAADDESRQRGLMYVRELPAGYGMLFLFETPRFASFWMLNTYLSLDIVFIDAAGIVVNIVCNAEPLSLAPIESVAPVKAVLELIAGTAARIGLVAGDRIVHPALAAR